MVYLSSVANSTSFEKYANLVFIPHILIYLESSKSVVVVWDTYIQDSLKEPTRERRAKGVRRKVASANKIPRNWKEFLFDLNNKTKQYSFLSEKIESTHRPNSKEIYITSGSEVNVKGGDRILPYCDHEEANTRLLVHIADALENECNSCLVRTVDYDVLAILIPPLCHSPGEIPSGGFFGTPWPKK